MFSLWLSKYTSDLQIFIHYNISDVLWLIRYTGGSFLSHLKLSSHVEKSKKVLKAETRMYKSCSVQFVMFSVTESCLNQ